MSDGRMSPTLLRALTVKQLRDYRQAHVLDSEANAARGNYLAVAFSAGRIDAIDAELNRRRTDGDHQV